MRNKKRATTTDIPSNVATLGGWSRARRVADVGAKVPSRRITINLDEDIIAIFKAEAFLGGQPYQVAINQALRSYLRRREMSENERAAQTVLKALDDQEVIRKLREIC